MNVFCRANFLLYGNMNDTLTHMECFPPLAAVAIIYDCHVIVSRGLVIECFILELIIDCVAT